MKVGIFMLYSLQLISFKEFLKRHRDVAAGNDHSDEIPVISIDDEDINPFFIECRTSAQCWLDGCSQDQDSVPSLSRSMSGASDGEDGYAL